MSPSIPMLELIHGHLYWRVLEFKDAEIEQVTLCQYHYLCVLILPKKSYWINHKLSQRSGIEVLAMTIHLTKKYA